MTAAARERWECPYCSYYSITDEADVVAESRTAHEEMHRGRGDIPPSVTPPPVRYTLETLPGEYLAFRTEHLDGRLLLSLIPDRVEQHALDTVACFLDDPKLRVASVFPTEEPVCSPNPKC